MTTLSQYLIGSMMGAGSILLVATSAFAQPLLKVTSSATALSFSTPTYERQPLPQKLDTAEAWQTVANNAFVAQDYLNSITAYSKAIDLADIRDRPQLLEERGWVRYLVGHFERADEDFHRAAQLHLQQDHWRDYRNVRQMRQFVEAQADRLDSSS